MNRFGGGMLSRSGHISGGHGANALTSTDLSAAPSHFVTMWAGQTRQVQADPTSPTWHAWKTACTKNDRTCAEPPSGGPGWRSPPGGGLVGRDPPQLKGRRSRPSWDTKNALTTHPPQSSSNAPPTLLQPSKIYRKSIKQPSNIYRTPSENL